MEKLNNIQNKGQWSDIASLLNENFSKIEQKITEIDISGGGSSNPDVDLSAYLKKDGDASQLEIGGIKLPVLFSDKKSDIDVLYFDDILNDATVSGMATSSSVYNIYYIKSKDIFAANPPLSATYFDTWGVGDSMNSARYNVDGASNKKAIYITSDLKIYAFFNNEFYCVNEKTTFADDLESKQDALVSGKNIATINGKSLLNGGNINISSDSKGVADDISNGIESSYIYIIGDGDIDIPYINQNEDIAFEEFIVFFRGFTNTTISLPEDVLWESVEEYPLSVDGWNELRIFKIYDSLSGNTFYLAKCSPYNFN